MSECKGCGAQLVGDPLASQWNCGYCKKVNYNDQFVHHYARNINFSKAHNLFQVGITAYEGGEYTEARSAFERSLTEDSSSRDAWVYCALSIAQLSDLSNIDRSITSVNSCLNRAKSVEGDTEILEVGESVARNLLGHTVLRTMQRHRNIAEKKYFAFESVDRIKANRDRDAEMKLLFPHAAYAFANRPDDPAILGQIAIEVLLASRSSECTKELKKSANEAIEDIKKKNPRFHQTLINQLDFPFSFVNGRRVPTMVLVLLGLIFIMYLPIYFSVNGKPTAVKIPTHPVTPAKGTVEESFEDSEWEKLFASLKGDVVLTPGVELIDANRQSETLPACIESAASKHGNVFKSDFRKDGRTEYVFCSQEGKSRNGDKITDIIVAEEKRGEIVVSARLPAYMPSLDFAGDIDGDGRIEVVAFDFAGGSNGSGRTYVISFAKGTPEFLPLTGHSNELDVGVLGASDIDKDGIFEFVVPNGGSYIGANASHELWCDLVNWNGDKSVIVTTRFEEFYSLTFVPYWENVGRGNDDAAKNCQALLTRFRKTFSNPSGDLGNPDLGPKDSISPNDSGSGFKSDLANKDGKAVESHAYTAVVSNSNEESTEKEQEGGGEEIGLLLSATNQVIHESSGSLDVIALNEIEVGKPFEVAISATNPLSRSMRGTISLSIVSDSVVVTPVSVGASFYDVGSELLSAIDSGSSIETVISSTPVIETYYPALESFENRSLLVKVLADQPGDYQFLVRATFVEPTKDFKIGLNLPESGVRDQQGFYCMKFSISAR